MTSGSDDAPSRCRAFELSVACPAQSDSRALHSYATGRVLPMRRAQERQTLFGGCPQGLMVPCPRAGSSLAVALHRLRLGVSIRRS